MQKMFSLNLVQGLCTKYLILFIWQIETIYNVILSPGGCSRESTDL